MKKYYVTCIVVRAKGVMTFVNDLVEYAELTIGNIQEFQKDVTESIYKREKALNGIKIDNIVLAAFSEIGECNKGEETIIPGEDFKG